VLWPSLTGDAPKSSEKQQIPASAAEANPAPTFSPPQLGTGQFVPTPVTAGQPTGTFVGQKVQGLRGELSQLQGVINQRNGQLQQIRNSTTQDSQRYHGLVAAVTTRLQLGTTPGNPVLVSQWNQAQSELDRLSSDIAAMNSLANEVAADAGLSSYLLQSSRATYGLSGAIDEDHRQLAILEDETNRTVVLIDRLLHELSDDIARQTTYVGNERSNLSTLALSIKNGEIYGASLANRAYQSAVPLAVAAPAPSGKRNFALDNREPLVVIRFDRTDVPYQQALYTAVSKALERRPQAQFDLVAVAATQGNSGQAAINQSQSRRNAERVLRTLTDMGLPADRVNLSATTSTQVATNEVHLYVR
jgi:TolA-binding protein